MSVADDPRSLHWRPQVGGKAVFVGDKKGVFYYRTTAAAGIDVDRVVPRGEHRDVRRIGIGPAELIRPRVLARRVQLAARQIGGDEASQTQR